MNGFGDGSHALVNTSVKTKRSFFTTSRYTPRFGKSLPSGLRMTNRLDPPARTSVFTSDVDQGFGANHFLSSSGSVHARHTFSGAASITRVTIRSRPSVEVAALLISNCLLLKFCS